MPVYKYRSIEDMNRAQELSRSRLHPNGLRVIDQSLINDVVRTIAERFHPLRIVLFGSQATGEAGPDSDLDLMVEMETDLKPVDRAIAIALLFGDRLWPLDVVVFTPAEVARDLRRVGSLVHMIETAGRTVYEHPRETA